MDKFDLFLKNLDELLAAQPPKAIDWQVGYWATVHAVRNAAHTAKCEHDNWLRGLPWRCDQPGCQIKERHGHTQLVPQTGHCACGFAGGDVAHLCSAPQKGLEE
jgi:hypothetical protein